MSDNLPPAPWAVSRDASNGWHYIPHPDGFPMLTPETECEPDLAALEFAALARNAFDVMMRRGWCALRDEYADDPSAAWFLYYHRTNFLTREELRLETWRAEHGFPDPFTALVEAERWYKENVEKHDA